MRYSGDTDGSDNWEYIKQQDSTGAADAAMNYPAFHWVNTYNTTYADKLGDANVTWYMPSLEELCEVYKNRDAINGSLRKIHGPTNGDNNSNDDNQNNIFELVYNPQESHLETENSGAVKSGVRILINKDWTYIPHNINYDKRKKELKGLFKTHRLDITAFMNDIDYGIQNRQKIKKIYDILEGGINVNRSDIIKVQLSHSANCVPIQVSHTSRYPLPPIAA